MKRHGWVIIGLALALVIALLSPLASSDPDGLERLAEEHGFAEEARAPWYTMVPDYLFPGIESEALATIASGIVGTLLVFAVMLGLGKWLAGRRSAASG